MKRTFRILTTLSFALLGGVIACDSGISSATLHGSVAGEGWQFEEGEGWISSDSSSYTAELYDEYYAACYASPGGNRLSLRIPSAEGTYDLQAAEFEAAFVIATTGPADEIEPDSGTLEVRQVDSGTLEGGLRLHRDADHHVEGRFTIVLCR